MASNSDISDIERPLVPRGPRLRGLRVPPKAVTLITVIAAWQALAILNDFWQFYNATLVPSPGGIVRATIELWREGTLWTHLSASCLRVLRGMGLAIPMAVAMAYLVATWKWAEIVFDPVIEFIRPVPSLALLPIFIVWFGIGELTKTIFITYSAFFIIFVATLEAIRDVDPVLKRAAGSMGMSPRQMAYHVTFKSVLPQIMVSIRLALATSWFVIVGAEFLAANEGLGYLINFSRVWFKIDTMMAAAALIGVLGLASNYLLLALERRLFAWRER
ncbi:ABC transporter permease [Allosediminivita pacifica]|uniref:NitT/TauT family transport system permease protein/sulfonate transport system permease protein n=1 Tax=Allosediminivita pacifica TaxID=1267769 RepID=A0A2T6AG11_9RHOB|nr:ABC transporter permease [Allosediminivita pacifica]PTX42729.1 NitT/TauT family transport system permease protein/sulfonate transport system permease protein [Allosediminivita pacifica]GGB06513.1 taurine ABC transporter permease [Allosediminivita pacifica]